MHNQIKIGVVGAGIYGEFHIQTYINNPNVSQVIVCDLNEKTLKEVTEKYNLKGYLDVATMILEENLDAVAICTPDPYHFIPIKEAIEAGIKNILVEKPLATTLKEIQTIEELVKQHDVNLVIDFHKRWDPAYNSMKDAIQASNDQYIRGYMSLDDIIEVPTQWFNWADASSPSWFLGVHCYDLIRYMTESEVKSVYAVGTEKVLKKRGLETLDSVTAVLTMEDGSHWTVENNWILPNSFPKSNDGQLVIVTDKQYFKNESYRGVKSYSPDKANIPNYIFMKFGENPSGFGLEPMQDFVDMVVKGTDYKTNFKDAYAASEIALAVHESVKTGKVIHLD